MNSIEYQEKEFPIKHSRVTSVHFATMLTTDSHPTGDDIDLGSSINNSESS